MDVQIQTMVVGPLGTNCYVLSLPERTDAVVIDPGGSEKIIRRALGERRVAAVLLTHGHFDHTNALGAVGENAEIVISEQDARMLEDTHLSAGDLVRDETPRPHATRLCHEGEQLTYAGMTFTVLETPGHTPGSVCYQIEDALFTGDTLFFAGYGRTDLPGGDMQMLKRSLKRLLAMRGTLKVYPGHEDETTIQLEAERML